MSCNCIEVNDVRAKASMQSQSQVTCSLNSARLGLVFLRKLNSRLGIKKLGIISTSLFMTTINRCSENGPRIMTHDSLALLFKSN